MVYGMGCYGKYEDIGWLVALEMQPSCFYNLISLYY
jgi:hypothetical protein